MFWLWVVLTFEVIMIIMECWIPSEKLSKLNGLNKKYKTMDLVQRIRFFLFCFVVGGWVEAMKSNYLIFMV